MHHRGSPNNQSSGKLNCSVYLFGRSAHLWESGTTTSKRRQNVGPGKVINPRRGIRTVKWIIPKRHWGNVANHKSRKEFRYSALKYYVNPTHPEDIDCGKSSFSFRNMYSSDIERVIAPHYLSKTKSRPVKFLFRWIARVRFQAEQIMAKKLLPWLSYKTRIRKVLLRTLFFYVSWCETKVLTPFSNGHYGYVVMIGIGNFKP